MEIKIRLLVNPIAGYGLAKFIVPDITYHLYKNNIKFKVFYPSSADDMKKYLTNLEDDEIVGFIGGDGTLHRIINYLPNFSYPICAFPSGTGNAYAKELKMPKSIAQIVEGIKSKKTVSWMIGVESNSGLKFGLFCGAGFHSQVIKQFQLHRVGTTVITSYLKWGIYCAMNEGLPKLSVEIDGTKVSNKTSWVEVLNISHYGGPLRPAPHANPADNQFDILIFNGKRKKDILKLLADGLLKCAGFTSHKCKEIEFFRGRNVNITSPTPIPFHMDGDYCGHTPVEITPYKERLKFVCP